MESNLRNPFPNFKPLQLSPNALPPQLCISPHHSQRMGHLPWIDPAPGENAPGSLAGQCGPRVIVSEENTNISSSHTNFRLGGWICGCHRPATLKGICAAATKDQPQPPLAQQVNSAPLRYQSSPQFRSARNGMLHHSGTRVPNMQNFPTQCPPAYVGAGQQEYPSSCGPLTFNVAFPSPLASPSAIKNTSHPILTPSGRALGRGGKVQNISSDLLSPCIMYWPENEPFPEQGQIRPSNIMHVPVPPILNTGNRGPISTQPGDWICQKCHYLNWRRRKVCQTCFPYAEGNGDSVSTAIAADRIPFLTYVPAQPPSPGAAHGQPCIIKRSYSTPPVHPPFVESSSPCTCARLHCSELPSDLDSQSAPRNPILAAQYESRQLHHPSPDQHQSISVETSAVTDTDTCESELLPSVLQELVHPPVISSPPTSWADLSERKANLPSSTPQSSLRWKFDAASLPTGSTLPSLSLSREGLIKNIWRFDREESFLGAIKSNLCKLTWPAKTYFTLFLARKVSPLHGYKNAWSRRSSRGTQNRRKSRTRSSDRAQARDLPGPRAEVPPAVNGIVPAMNPCEGSEKVPYTALKSDTPGSGYLPAESLSSRFSRAEVPLHSDGTVSVSETCQRRQGIEGGTLKKDVLGTGENLHTWPFLGVGAGSEQGQARVPSHLYLEREWALGGVRSMEPFHPPWINPRRIHPLSHHTLGGFIQAALAQPNFGILGAAWGPFCTLYPLPDFGILGAARGLFHTLILVLRLRAGTGWYFACGFIRAGTLPVGWYGRVLCLRARTGWYFAY
ncbi:hypothetical protein C8R43DRAFT_944935 [Mycena crocata]|nr:hypothetical protein C8R43DRAFT_944935 [Mycena crocata]